MKRYTLVRTAPPTTYFELPTPKPWKPVRVDFTAVAYGSIEAVRAAKRLLRGEI